MNLTEQWHMQHATQSTDFACKELHSNPVVRERIDKHIYRALDQIVQENHKNFSRQAYSFLEVQVKLRHLRRKNLECK